VLILAVTNKTRKTNQEKVTMGVNSMNGYSTNPLLAITAVITIETP